jgi:hypothetical protein
VVTNDGNVTMREVTVADAFGDDVTCPAATLAPGDSMTCTATRTYLVTQADLDAAQPLRRTASAVGVQPGATEPATFAPGSASVPLDPPAPKLSAEQNAFWQDVDGDGVLGPADPITSTLVVVNIGNVTVRALTVSGLPAGVTCTPTVLAPGERATCVSLPYHLTAEQIADGVHREEATVSGATQAGPEVEEKAPATIVAPSPSGPATSTGSPTTVPASPTATATRTVSPSASPSASVPVTVSPAPGDEPAGSLPTTGSNIAGVMLGGGALVAAGVVLLLVSGRRHRGVHRRGLLIPSVATAAHRAGRRVPRARR